MYEVQRGLVPQAGMRFEAKRRETHHNSCKTNDLVKNTGLVNGAVVYNGCSASANRTSGRIPAGTLYGPKPAYRINGYINHGYRGKSKKAAPSGTLKKQGSKNSVLNDASAADGVSGEDVPSGKSAKASAQPSNIQQVVPDPSLSASGKKQRRRRRFRPKNSAERVAYPANRAFVPPREEEDWENEIQEVTLSGWEKLCFGVQPYGPEDVLHFALRDMTLRQRDTADLPVTAGYNPAVHHPCPLTWSCYNTPTVPDQFADAD
ncbi:uncharacterized protein LOC115787282 [Archocentrus centrarchus]|uniref:uncharacterized protein LOC115787282 n=1 Tax=Archocentrus centrarchus TaxID=63155 RepID=UPI0011EA391E|nr:uncharacterized protein LOC115787282 [Archocentrus centrarchus]XP_030595765.1 uncharacterized protein LOC115787282 [Archocentrus centrarchus]XP_030595774.1 uncharacterized protein LOC115787282 [Archocentrus centrarchus]